jgi:hypothetical protein
MTPDRPEGRLDEADKAFRRRTDAEPIKGGFGLGPPRTAADMQRPILMVLARTDLATCSFLRAMLVFTEADPGALRLFPQRRAKAGRRFRARQSGLALCAGIRLRRARGRRAANRNHQ